MTKGVAGKILRVDLTSRTTKIDERTMPSTGPTLVSRPHRLLPA